LGAYKVIKVSIFTSTRAEYGLLYWLIKGVEENPELELQLVVAGTHLSHDYGYTIADILRDGFQPVECIANLISDDSPQAITRSSALLAMSLADYFARELPDFFVVLGDRVELLAACEAAMIAKVPIIHLHGGEITEGAVDDKVRHSVTKLASLHFASTDMYRRRIIQMGEHPDSVVNCGALGLESLFRKKILSREELSASINVDLSGKYFLVVYHPETNKNSENIDALLSVLKDYPEYKKVIIYPNSDMMSRYIINSIKGFEKKYPEQVHLIKSMGRDEYLSLMNNCDLYIGNSSSGIIEMPSFFRPIVNIGDRQKGRIRSESTIDVEMSYKGILAGVEQALSLDFTKRLANIQNPYAGDSPSQVIIDKILSVATKRQIEKKFLDLDFKL
jgi:UDP-hydrolysing UDP-N-acetyl-D-glucosamine 2-epimerase